MKWLLIQLAAALVLFPSRGAAQQSSFWICDTTWTPDTLWTLQTGAPVYSSPTYCDGTIFIGSDNGYLYALDAANGNIKWKFQSAGIVRCKPAVADTIVYFESDDGYLYAVGKISGVRVWASSVGNNVTRVLPDPSTSFGNYWDYMQSSPCVDGGTVYLGSGDSCVYALDAVTGSQKWRTRTGGLVRSSPCAYGSNIYVGSWDGFIYALRKSDGSVLWSYDTHGFQYKNVQPSPRVADGIVLCGSRNPAFYGIDAATGKKVWSHSFDFSWVESSAAVANGIAYVGSSDLNQVHAFKVLTGDVLWTGSVPGDTWSSPIIRNGVLYIGLASYGGPQKSGGLLAMDASTGKIKWRTSCGSTSFIGGVVSSPEVSDTVVYYGSLDGKVYATVVTYNVSYRRPDWVAADFEKSSTSNGLEGFYVPSYAVGSLSRIADAATVNGTHVLKAEVDLAQSPHMFAAMRDTVPLRDDAELDKFATGISLEVYLPAKVPAGGLVELIVAEGVNDSLTVVDTIGTGRMKTGQWNTISMNVDSIISLGKLNPNYPARVGVVIYYPSPLDTTTWKGSVLFDNLVIHGISMNYKLIDKIGRGAESHEGFRLYGSFPDPFNPSTVIRYAIPRAARVIIRIFDVLGREIATLLDGYSSAGEHEVRFDATHYSAGVYFAQLYADGYVGCEKMILVK